MLKVIDLDSQGKDADGFVFTLTIGDARYGVTDQEVAELIRTKYSSGKGGSKRPAPKKSPQVEQASSDAMPLGGSDSPASDMIDSSH